MTSSLVLIELLQRLAGNHGQEILISGKECNQWSPAEFRALRGQRIITKSTPAPSAQCPGCEEVCIMPVHRQAFADSHSLFIVCDKRDDTSRVAVDALQLAQWRFNIESICAFVSSTLGIRRSENSSMGGGLLPLGTVSGNKRCHMLHLESGDQFLLKASASSMPLADIVTFDGNSYGLDSLMLGQWLDTVSVSGNSYVPNSARREARKLDTQELHESWQKAFRQLKKKHPEMSDVWCSQKIAKMEIGKDRCSETIRKHMKK